MKLLIIMMMFTTVNSYALTLKQIALQKMELNNSETVQTGLINRGINCNSSLKDDDGINNPTTADAIRYTAYRYEECYTRADTHLEFVGNYEEEWAQPAPVPVVSPVSVTDPVAVKDTTYVKSDPTFASTEYVAQEATFFDPAQEPAKETWVEEPTMDTTRDETLLNQPRIR